MKQLSLDAQVRNETGKGAARKLRRTGRLPGVLYGPKSDPVPLSVDMHLFNKALMAGKGEQILFNLTLKDNGQTGERLVLIKELQLHPVNDQIRHVDFYEVHAGEKVQVDVPIRVTGKAVGVDVAKGVLEIIQRSVRIACLPMSIPNEIDVDVTNLDVGDALHIADLKPPEGVEFLDDPKTTLVTVVGSTVQEETAAEEEETEEETE